MELLKLFFIFFRIGLFTFGGGMAMIPLFREYLVPSYITSEQLTDFIGISESTPGPFAVNISTFVGVSQGGIIGAIVCTLGVVLPSFLILLLISMYSSKFLKNKIVNDALILERYSVVGLLVSVFISLLLVAVLPNIKIKEFILDFSAFDPKALGIILIDLYFLLFYRKFSINFDLSYKIKRGVSPISIIILSGILGIVVYGVL
jgi:chromate transporter